MKSKKTIPASSNSLAPEISKPIPKRSKTFLYFILKFAVLFIAFEICYFNESLYQHVFAHINSAFASATSHVLSWIGITAVHHSDNISNNQFAMSVKQGCDSMEALAIFICGVLAFPSTLKLKLSGLLIGSAIILTMNLIRLVHLFWVGIHQRDLFDLFHLEIWQGFFIILSIVLWLLWILKAVKPIKS